MTQLLLQIPADRQQAWLDALADQMPELEVVVWPDVKVGAKLDYALVWQPPLDVFEATAHTQVFFSLGAGVDHLLPHLGVIADRPIVRMVDPTLAEGMTEYVIYFVLMFHRAMHTYAQFQSRRDWTVLEQLSPSERHIGVLGLGAIGGQIATTLASLGFVVHGFSRSGTDLPNVISHAGDAGLQSLIEQVDIVVNVLPLTTQTKGLLNQAFFERMKKGASLINIGRGAHLVESDLIQVMRAGHLSAAALDVFETEPLAKSSPLWDLSNVFVTPHMASLTQPRTAAVHVVNNIRKHMDGSALWPVFESTRGY